MAQKPQVDIKQDIQNAFLEEYTAKEAANVGPVGKFFQAFNSPALSISGLMASTVVPFMMLLNPVTAPVAVPVMFCGLVGWMGCVLGAVATNETVKNRAIKAIAADFEKDEKLLERYEREVLAPENAVQREKSSQVLSEKGKRLSAAFEKQSGVTSGKTAPSAPVNKGSAPAQPGQ